VLLIPKIKGLDSVNTGFKFPNKRNIKKRGNRNQQRNLQLNYPIEKLAFLLLAG